MRKILTTLLLLVCSSGVFAQYMSSGVVSQGTLINNRTEIIRSGFDIWAGGGVGVGMDPNEIDMLFYNPYYIDANVGYNVTPRLFLGAGVQAGKTYTSVLEVYGNMRIFGSRQLNTTYFDLHFGKISSNDDYLIHTYREAYKEIIACCHKPQGMTGGFSFGYLWNHFALEVGLDIAGTYIAEIIADAPGSTTASEIDWQKWIEEGSIYGEGVYATIDLFVKLSWRF